VRFCEADRLMIEQMNSKPATTRSGSIAILAYHFRPSREVGAKRMNALTSALCERGDDVCVFSAFEGLPLDDVQPQRQEPIGYEMQLVRYSPSKALGLLVAVRRYLRRRPSRNRQPAKPPQGPTSPPAAASRSRAYRLFFDFLYVIDSKKQWALRATYRMLSASRAHAFQTIVVSGPPMSSLIAGIIFGRRLGIPVITDLRDPIYAEDAKTLSGEGVPVRWGRERLERFVAHHSSHITTSSPTVQRWLQTRYPSMSDRVTCVFNGFDDAPLPQRVYSGNRLVAVYAGSLYMNRDPFPFLEALDRLLNQPKIDQALVEVIFAGDCHSYRGIVLHEWLAERKCRAVVKLRSRVDSDELKHLYQRATLLLNFAEGQSMQIPAKTFELLALGREILTFCEPTSDTASVVSGIDGVSCVTSDDSGALSVALLDIYNRHVIHGTLRSPSHDAISGFSRASQNARFLRAIDVATGDRSVSPASESA
jgi:hypothetical protein